MDTSFYIARRLALNEKKSFSRFIIRIAILAVGLSIAIMIIGSAITRGYQEVIKEKFYDCWGHIHITTFLPDPTNINNEEMIPYDSSLVKSVQAIKGVQSIQAYNIQSAILKTKTDAEGLLLKGVSEHKEDYFSKRYIIEGHKIDYSDTSYSKDILISQTTASKLNLKVDDNVIIYFLTKNDIAPKARKIKIAGIYKTGLDDYDNVFGLVDSRLINHINLNTTNSIQGYEVYVKNESDKEKIEHEIFKHHIHEPLQTYTLDKRFANVFSWLGMMKMNEQIIIIIMMIIAIINMITALLILVMERTQMIGVLKSMGMQNTQIRKVFIFSSVYILSIGMLLGTILGIGLCLLQQKFGLLKLNEKNYYIKIVPIFLEPKLIIFINVMTLVVCTLLLMIPSYIIKTISPTKALKFN